MEAVTSKVTSKDGTQIAYDRTGSGYPIILVDGAMCSRAFGPMPGLAPLLADHFTVFTYDRRGRNQSGDTQPYAVAREVEDIAALIEAAGGSAYLFGASSGGGLSLEAAASGLNIPRVAVYEPPYVADPNGRRPPADTVARLNAMIAEGRRGDAVEYFMVQMVGGPPEMVAPMRSAPFWPALEAIAHTIAYDASVMGEWSFPAARMSAITVPTLAAYGGASPEMMRQSADAIAAALPNARTRVLPGQTHEIVADVIAPVLVQFFKE
jgi:pimeloyl-ACP methyl ester carboxylesterase